MLLHINQYNYHNFDSFEYWKIHGWGFVLSDAKKKKSYKKHSSSKKAKKEAEIEAVGGHGGSAGAGGISSGGNGGSSSGGNGGSSTGGAGGAAGGSGAILAVAGSGGAGARWRHRMCFRCRRGPL